MFTRCLNWKKKLEKFPRSPAGLLIAATVAAIRSTRKIERLWVKEINEGKGLRRRGKAGQEGREKEECARRARGQKVLKRSGGTKKGK